MLHVAVFERILVLFQGGFYYFTPKNIHLREYYRQWHHIGRIRARFALYAGLLMDANYLANRFAKQQNPAHRNICVRGNQNTLLNQPIVMPETVFFLQLTIPTVCGTPGMSFTTNERKLYMWKNQFSLYTFFTPLYVHVTMARPSVTLPTSILTAGSVAVALMTELALRGAYA